MLLRPAYAVSGTDIAYAPTPQPQPQASCPPPGPRRLSYFRWAYARATRCPRAYGAISGTECAYGATLSLGDARY
eukprot:1173896-Rhodomonas_salina.1